jgi:hypothetical protein
MRRSAKRVRSIWLCVRSAWPVLSHTHDARLDAHQSGASRSRNAMVTTETEYWLFAAAAMIGRSSQPNAG